jgi:hypothetical protein
MFVYVLENPIIFGSLLFAGLLLCMEFGRRIGRRRLARDPDALDAGTGAVDGMVFALFGLLVAFTFSGAASRFDDRRALIVTEANDIGTAYLRIDLLPEAAQTPLRDAFHRYVNSRMASYAHGISAEDFEKSFAKTQEIQAEIWTMAVEAGRLPEAQPAANMLLLPAINEMIDITSTRAAAIRMHPPWPIFAMLLATALVCALLAGNAMLKSRSPNWIDILGFAAITTITMYVILDLEYPRRGLIQVDALDQMLKDAVK